MSNGLPACILLVYGLPACGKTLLTTSLVDYSIRDSGVIRRNFITIHFDDFFPPDTRQYKDDHQIAQVFSSDEPFILKELRHKVNDCLEYFISLNRLGCHNDEVQTTGHTVPVQWDTFVKCVNSNHSHPILDDTGSLRQEFQQPTALILDDNMPLSSIRHEYYQMARKYQMGFMEVCVVCSLQLALERNSLRQIPISSSTLETMERSMETPDPTKHHWEERSTVIHNESNKEAFVKAGIELILPMVEWSFSHPVIPIAKEDVTMKEVCRAANLESFVHQADMVLRSCVSELLKHTTSESLSRKAKAELAKKANTVRRKILDEVRETKKLDSWTLTSSTVDHSGSEHFKRIVEEKFKKQLIPWQTV